MTTSRSRGLSVDSSAGPDGPLVITCTWCGARETIDGRLRLVAQIRAVALRHEDCEPDAPPAAR